jgi:hypothetical protein
MRFFFPPQSEENEATVYVGWCFLVSPGGTGVKEGDKNKGYATRIHYLKQLSCVSVWQGTNTTAKMSKEFSILYIFMNRLMSFF